MSDDTPSPQADAEGDFLYPCLFNLRRHGRLETLNDGPALLTHHWGCSARNFMYAIWRRGGYVEATG